MKFTETKIKGVVVVDIDPLKDERGFFARMSCAREFSAHGLKGDFVQSSMSYNHIKDTLRGMHYQADPHQEAKLVHCVQGCIYDVVIDLRRGSLTFCQWICVDLTQDNARAVYIPEGCAHGFQTLVDNTVVFYQMTEFFHPECASGVRWDDPAFGIKWPEVKARVISDKDRGYSDF